jgi:hypothetical protein
MRTVNYNGNQIQVEDVAFDTITEPWAVVAVGDGTGNMLRIKPVITGVAKVVGQTNADGTPIYLHSVQIVQVTECPRKDEA